jgi:hypothetical protein
MIKRVFIIGGGFSIRDNLWNIPISNLPLWNIIKNEFTIGTNFVFHWFTPTVLMYSDYQFYASQKKYLKDIPLILGKEDSAYKRKNGIQLDTNVLLLKECEKIIKTSWREPKPCLQKHYWGKDAWTKGFYTSQLIGIKALNLAIALDCKEIYLLGMDACADSQDRTHFYSDTEIGVYEWQGQKHSGVGKNKRGGYNTGNYNKIDELNKYWYQPFEEELKRGVKIYNVSVNSKIETFPKITYKEMYDNIQKNVYFIHDYQNRIRDEIKKRLK